MKRINILCVLILLLVTDFSAYAQVTDGGVTAYRPDGAHSAVLFTDNPSDSPLSVYAPLGAGTLILPLCGGISGGEGTSGQICIGTYGDPIADYTCTIGSVTGVDSDTTWCLFSENPRTGGKAWAVKYVNGEIPTNDGTSIVRCEATDTFHPDYGCGESLPSQISIKGGYMKMDATDGNAPFDGDCTETTHKGRMVVDNVNSILYICTDSGWIGK